MYRNKIRNKYTYFFTNNLSDDFGWKASGALDFDEHSISAERKQQLWLADTSPM